VRLLLVEPLHQPREMGYTVRLLQCSTLLAPPRRYLQIRVVLRCPLQVATNQLASLLEQLASRNGSSRPRHHQGPLEWWDSQQSRRRSRSLFQNWYDM